jgi:ubiquinone/menaquinone biosynthesis C-methylase UbiE
VSYPALDRGVVSLGRSPGITLEPLSLQFVICAQAIDATALDVGCGDGVATIALLARGGHVVAVDPDAAALHRLVERVPTEQCQRLKVRLGRLPDIDFKVANFGAIHAAHVLHLLDPVSVGQSLGKFYRWLYPKGKLFVSALTPAGALQAARAGSMQPGRLYPLDEQTLCRAISAAGFAIEESATYVPQWRRTQECCAVIASVS